MDKFLGLFYMGGLMGGGHCKSENYHQPWWDIHLKINLGPPIELRKDLSFRLIANRF